MWALPIASRVATGTKAKVLPALRHMALWFSKPISRGSRPSASAMRSRAGGDALAFSGSFGASNSANGACPSRKRTPTRTEPIACSSRMMTSLSPLTSGVRACASRIAVPMVGWPANESSRAGVKKRTRAECAGLLGFSTNAVSDRLSSRAMLCICSVLRASASLTTASGLPQKRRSVKTSSVCSGSAMRAMIPG